MCDQVKPIRIRKTDITLCIAVPSSFWYVVAKKMEKYPAKTRQPSIPKWKTSAVNYDISVQISVYVSLLGSFGKPPRRRQRDRHQRKGSMSKTMVLHVRFEPLCISSPSSPKQQREISKLHCTYFEECVPQWLIFRVFLWNWTLSLHIQLEQVFRPIDALNRSTQLRHSRVNCNIFFYKAP